MLNETLIPLNMFFHSLHNTAIRGFDQIVLIFLRFGENLVYTLAIYGRIEMVVLAGPLKPN